MNPLRPQQMPMANPMPNQPMGQGMGGPINNGPMNAMQQMIFNGLYNSNPQFRQFADSMRGKTPEQAFQEQGLDYNQYRNIGPEQMQNMFGF